MFRATDDFLQFHFGQFLQVFVFLHVVSSFCQNQQIGSIGLVTACHGQAGIPEYMVYTLKKRLIVFAIDDFRFTIGTTLANLM